MPWWVWTLLVWSVLALALGVALSRMIRVAERRELGHDRRLEVQEPEEQEPEGRPRAS